MTIREARAGEAEALLAFWTEAGARLTAIVVHADGDAAAFWRSAGFESQTTNRRFVESVQRRHSPST